ncbi:MAG: GHMP kinase [Candidatus Lokiarchaeota archaeon]|nr:GHMP kinase [Candidatus Lokiarchaeota archaeon]MBD3201329.1 GHMP kinase [Candidatus Lokiarchaeota archaeon]
MKIRAKAPFRVSFGGGGTDMAPYCVEHGGCVINTAIDRHVYVTLVPRDDKKIRVKSINFNKQNTFDIGDVDYSEEFELFKGTVNVLGISDGFNITAFSELPAGSGMGGSSSLSVALIGAFNEFYDLGLNRHEIAQKAYDIERIELEQKGGYQDQFAAAYGGFNYVEFTDEVKVFPVQTTSEMINELHYRLILCYVGGSHFSSDIQDEVLEGYKIEKKSYMESMSDLKDVAHSMRDLIESKNISDLNKFGEYLHQGWLAKKSLSDKISNRNIENFYLTSRKHGVIGGKLLGAGGGGHLLLFSKPSQKYQVVEELEEIGGKIVNFHFNHNGLEVWKC